MAYLGKVAKSAAQLSMHFDRILAVAALCGAWTTCLLASDSSYSPTLGSNVFESRKIAFITTPSSKLGGPSISCAGAMTMGLRMQSEPSRSISFSRPGANAYCSMHQQPLFRSSPPPLKIHHQCFWRYGSPRLAIGVSTFALKEGDEEDIKKPDSQMKADSQDSEEEDDDVEDDDEEEDEELIDDSEDEVEEEDEDDNEDGDNDVVDVEASNVEDQDGIENHNNEAYTDTDGFSEDSMFEEEAEKIDKAWEKLTKSEIVTEVQKMYGEVDDYSRDENLIRARIEMRHEQEGGDGALDIEAELQKMLDFEKQKKDNTGRSQNQGIPGEVAIGPPQISPAAEFEVSHMLHLELSRKPIFDIARISLGDGILEKAEEERQFLTAEQISNLTLTGKCGQLEASVANNLRETAYDVMMAAPKAASLKMPTMTIAGGEMYRATQAIGDLFPSMMARLFARHIQYGIVTKTQDWTNADGLSVFGKLICELAIPSEAMLLLLRSTESEIYARVVGEEKQALIKPHFDMILAHVATAIKTEKMNQKPKGTTGLPENWRDNWEDVPLRDYWEDTDFVDLPQYLEQMRSGQAGFTSTQENQTETSHPLEHPLEWRRWAENTAFENTKEKPVPIEEIFSNVFINLPGELNRRWMKGAGILDEKGQLITKMEPMFAGETSIEDFGPLYNKKKSKKEAEGKEEGEEVLDDQGDITGNAQDEDDDDDGAPGIGADDDEDV